MLKLRELQQRVESGLALNTRSCEPGKKKSFDFCFPVLRHWNLVKNLTFGKRQIVLSSSSPPPTILLQSAENMRVRDETVKIKKLIKK